MTPPDQSLCGCRVLSAINGLELFGQEKENLAVLQALRDMGAEVLVGINALEQGGQVGEWLRLRNFQVFELPFGNQWSWKWLRIAPLSIFDKAGQVFHCSRILRRVIREFQPTHIHLCSPLAYSFVAPALHYNDTPVVYRIGDRPPADSWFNLIIWRAAMRRADVIVPISKFIQGEVTQATRGLAALKCMHIYPTVPVASQPQMQSRQPEFRVCYVGQVTGPKGIWELIEAFEQVSTRHPELGLDVCGSGPDLESAMQKVKDSGLEDRITFHGYLADPQTVLRRSLFQIVPSLWLEGLGLVALEAKAQGVPAIVFPSGGLRETIHHKVDGYICAEPTVSGLTEAMLWMLSPDADLPGMNKAALADSASRFGINAYRRSWAEVFQHRRRSRTSGC